MKKWLAKGILGIAFAFPISGIVHAADALTVQLSNYIGNKTALNVVLRGNYSIQNSTVTLSPNITYSVKAESGKIRIYKDTTVVLEGTSLQLNPSTSTTYLEIEGRKYLGIMTFKNESGVVRPYNQIDLESYLKGVVPSEMSENWGNTGGLEALKAQAVTARTYTVAGGYTSKAYITDTQTHQVYGGYFPTYTNSIQAVDSTKGQIMTYNNAPISALYSSSNGGYIESNRGAWGSTLLPYLSAKPDKFDPINQFTYSISETELVNKLNTKNPGYTIKAVSLATRVGYTDGQRTVTMRFLTTAIDGTTHTFDMDASSFRTLLGTSNIKSIYLNEPTKLSEIFTFTGQGFGHGVGMSQYGALAMSQQGYDYKNILGFYFTGTQLYNGSTYTNLIFTDKTLAPKIQTLATPVIALEENPKSKPLIREAKKQKPPKPIRITAKPLEVTAKVATIVTHTPKNLPPV
ncbi:hypothetical protein CN918_26050 [Priestia megaterium]|nr:hypothetical protein CN918_26050 [Priestia megaterium]